MASRWDHLFEARPVPLVDHLLEEVARLLATDLSRWPPPVQEVDALTTSAAFAELLAGEHPRPAPAVYTEALKLARLDLRRELDAYDEYMRNQRYLEQGLAPADRPALLLLERWLVEQLLALAEATEGRLKRPQLLRCLDLVEHRLRAPAPPGRGRE
ncbi:MAG TPA: hypothetical protein VFO83_00270 [Aggregicoccus sp.]|nr:hypothetical protein [Aggregicoccus sp.]